MAAKKKAVTRRKKTGTSMMSMADMEKLMAEDAEKESERAVTTEGNTMSIRGGSFTYQGADIGEEIEVVIIDFCNVNSYYDGPFDPDEPSSPCCWSVSKEKPRDMIPSQESPKVQCDDCANCWANEYGSAATGRGKACKNSRRLAVVAIDDLEPGKIKEAEVAYINVPPTSNKAFDKMSNGVRKVHKRPLYGVVSVIGFNTDVDYEALTFSPKEVIMDPAILLELKELKETIEDDLMAEPDPANYREPPARKAPKKKVVKKKAARRK